MVTATFRFYDGLGDFLPRERRGRAFDSPCARAATVKHMVEALGVPHTEVSLILVNGESSGFERLLADGDRVAVYPAFGSLDVAAVQRVRTRPPGRLRFIADAHLGGLARLLRMAGFDTLYENGYRDEEIVAIAAGETRVVLTRDRELLKRRDVDYGCYLHAIRPAAQVWEVFARYDLHGEARPFTLCLSCNLPLRPVEKTVVFERLPESVRTAHTEFTVCDACDRVFWKGSHHRRMAGMLDALEADAAGEGMSGDTAGQPLSTNPAEP